MNEQMLQESTLAQLRIFARSAGMKGFTGYSKKELIDAILKHNNFSKEAQSASGVTDNQAPVGKAEQPQPESNAEEENKERAVAEARAQQKPEIKRAGRPKKNTTADAETDKEAEDKSKTELKRHPEKKYQFDKKNTPHVKENAKNTAFQKQAPAEQKTEPEKTAVTEEEPAQAYVPRNPNKPSKNYYNNATLPDILSSNECGEATGILEIHPDGYGFLRTAKFMDNKKDVYVSIAQIRRFNLRNGDKVTGKTRPLREGERYYALLYISAINDEDPEKSLQRKQFDDLTPIYPDKRITLEPREQKGDLALRIIDLVAPIGFGQRALIVAQPKAGKTVLLKNIANAITANYPGAELIVLLIDERPEEVTDMQRSIKGEVVYSTFDELPDNHTKVAEAVLDRAERSVERGKDVIILMDSLTRLARAYNQVAPVTGRTLTGGLDMGALHKPKKFFGTARNVEEGGSLTIIATALVETGSRMDDIIYEEFKGTGNCEIHLDRKLSERRVFPAIDIAKSGTRREEALLSNEELQGIWSVRKIFATTSAIDATEQFISMMVPTRNNAEFLDKLKDWIRLMEHDGFKMISQDKY